jgi:hypothetical protein
MAATDPVAMRDAPSESRGIAALKVLTTPMKSTSKASMKVAAVPSAPSGAMPAFPTTTSSPPSSATAKSTAASISARSQTSPTYAMARRSSFSIIRTV